MGQFYVTLCGTTETLQHYYSWSYSVAARECLPPSANVCIAAPAHQISSAIRVFFRISDMGV